MPTQPGEKPEKADSGYTTTAGESFGKAVGFVIGPYHLLERIGEGGMGEVWLAEQREPVRRRVALKLIKAGMDTREVVARFESERQALALMDHPAIAKVFDAGSTPEGRPYFVMEFVAGIPITAYCDKHKLTTRQRMELFTRVCEGVQHAHQKAIIHRDLKPSNILVSEVDGQPMPRIIDFGLAKATSHRLTDGSMYTRVGAMLGTLEYMSPEQADSAGEDIDTRTDVYSLGVVLYQLLVAALPLDLNKLAYAEMLRRLREEDVPRPSSRILTQGGDSAITAQNRGTDPPSLTRQLRGDPDAIVLKALEKDRKRRYGSPSELAADIGRYLRNEPVSAHVPSAAYRAGKYIRRHRLAVATITGAVLLLAGFAITEAVQLRRITQERDRATRERDRADRIATFLIGMFQATDPYAASGQTVTARDILDKGAKSIETGLKNDPELRSQMMNTMGLAYNGLSEYSRAQSMFEGAVEIQRRIYGSESRQTAHTMFLLACALEFGNRHAESEKLLRETLDIQSRVTGPDSQDALGTTSELAASLLRQGRYADAETLYRRAFDGQRRTIGPENPDTLYSMSALAIAIGAQGRYAEAEKLQRDALEIDRRVFGPEDWTTLFAMGPLGTVLAQEGRYADSEKVEREELGIRRRILGPEHADTLACAENLAATLTREGRFDEAERLFRDSIAAATKAGRPEPIADAWYNFACAAAVAGHHRDALEYLGNAVDHGFANPGQMGVDSDLKSLHGDPRFDSLLAKAGQAAAPKAK